MQTTFPGGSFTQFSRLNLTHLLEAELTRIAFHAAPPVNPAEIVEVIEVSATLTLSDSSVALPQVLPRF